MRLAWFTPRAPVHSGIVRYSEEILPVLARDHEIDVFDERAAHEFVWRHFTRPYALTIYQLGNAECHDYMWPYLFRYPGLTVLHDAQLHQSRAAALLTRRRRPDEYRAEFAASHPDAPPGVAELAIHGLAGGVLPFWPLLRTVVTSARLVAVHSQVLADDLRERFPDAAIDTISMGVPDAPHAPGRAADEWIEFAAIGRVTPEKRIGPALAAFAAVARECPGVRLTLVGEAADYYDALADARALGVIDRVTLTGYVPDAALDARIASADVCLCLRWPSNGETSASWLRCLAAGRPTIITDLVHQAHVPSLDPRTWAPLPDGHDDPPVAVSIDVLDEDHSLRLAMRRLATDAELRATLGSRAREYWRANHTMDRMANDYGRVIAAAANRMTPKVALPPHVRADGTDLAIRLAADVGVDVSFLKG
jgi:glycosyltransferase involved in cell wall biosynthesis